MVTKGRLGIVEMILAVAVLLPSSFCFGEDEMSSPGSGKLTALVAESEVESMDQDIRQWTDPGMIEKLASVKLTDDYMRDLYKEFVEMIVSPPAPDDTKEYGIEHGEESLEKVIALGRRIHNLGQAVSGEDFEKYGDLLKAMRDILFLDSRHIPLAIKHDNSRDVYWVNLHNKLLEETREQYKRLFST